jgi:HlyD family secretion protein
MRNKLIFSMVVLGIVAGLISAYVYAVPTRPQGPAFSPASNPYAKGIYANGIVESYQTNGENINIYPEVQGTVTAIFVDEGACVTKGAPLIAIEDSVPRATAEQQEAQAEAARALLGQLKAQPRRETLAVARAQVDFASASLKNAQDQLDKQARAYEIDPRSVSRDALDNAKNAAKVARANLEVVTKQYELTKAGAWIWDVRNQESQVLALLRAAAASRALLEKYTIRAPVDGVVLSVDVAVGSYISPQGAYSTYTQGFGPALVMGSSKDYLAVRSYIDEILIFRLPHPERMRATMFVRGTTREVPLEFVRLQPYVTPKIQLSNARTERVDVRVLPVLFRFKPPKDLAVYAGELVDVYVAED